MNKTKSWLFEKIDRIDEPLATGTKRKQIRTLAEFPEWSTPPHPLGRWDCGHRCTE